MKTNWLTWLCPKCETVILHADRHRDGNGKLSKHCGCRVKKTKGMTPGQLAAHKRQVMIDLKRKYRKERGSKSRAEITAKVETARQAQAPKTALKKAIAYLHDAHVRRYKTLIKSRFNAREYYKKHAVEVRQKKSQYKANLADSYVVYNLKRGGMPDAAITEKVIELKREAMECTRLMRMLKTAIKNDWKETNETIAKHP